MGDNTFQVWRSKRDNVHEALSIMPGIQKLLWNNSCYQCSRSVMAPQSSKGQCNRILRAQREWQHVKDDCSEHKSLLCSRNYSITNFWLPQPPSRDLNAKRLRFLYSFRIMRLKRIWKPRRFSEVIHATSEIKEINLTSFGDIWHHEWYFRKNTWGCREHPVRVMPQVLLFILLACQTKS